MTPDSLALIRNSDNSKLEEFLKTYPYGYKRKVLILELIEQHHPLLESNYAKIIQTAILRNPTNNSMIDFKVWAFSVIDMTFDKIQDMPINDNDKQAIDPIIQSVINELTQD